MLAGAMFFGLMAAPAVAEDGSETANWWWSSNDPTLYDIISADDGEFDVLTAGVNATGLKWVLDFKWVRLTAFAPTDAAFVDLVSSLAGSDLTEEETIATLGALAGIPEWRRFLRKTILYHVTWGERDASEVLSRNKLWMVRGGKTRIDATDVEIIGSASGPASIVATNVEASNGIAHVIDTVLLSSRYEVPALP